MGRVKDLTGMKFGRLTVIERRGSDKRGNAMWLCKCECGNEIVIRGYSLKNKHTTSCGCLQKEIVIKDLTGMKFDRLTVVKEYGRDKGGNVTWLCKCECGNEIVINGNNLRSGNTTSCGCLQKEKVGEINYKGGISPISMYLRSLSVVQQWRKDTYIRENNRCQLTGKYVHGGNSSVHHLYGFNMIVVEAHTINGIEIKPQVKDYTEEELKLLEEYVASWHKDTSNAVLLCDEVHNLFHDIYGYGNNTKQQYIEFKERKQRGDVNDN